MASVKYAEYVSENADKIINFLQTGSLLEYCAIEEVSYHSVYKWCKKQGVEIKNVQSARSREKLSKSHIALQPEYKDDIEDMYFNKEMSFSQIGKHYGVAAPTVFNFFKRHGIVARTKEEGSRLVEWSDEKRDAYRQRGYDIYLNTRKTGTKPELEFMDWCNSRGIMFIEQWRKVRGTNHPYDFLLPAYNLIVEIDGHYWHSKPEQVEKDMLHLDYAVKSGYNIVRICTNELKVSNGDYMKFLGEYIDGL